MDRNRRPSDHQGAVVIQLPLDGRRTAAVPSQRSFREVAAREAVARQGLVPERDVDPFWSGLAHATWMTVLLATLVMALLAVTGMLG